MQLFQTTRPYCQTPVQVEVETRSCLYFSPVTIIITIIITITITISLTKIRLVPGSFSVRSRSQESESGVGVRSWSQEPESGVREENKVKV